jgi:hypothetical protein
MKSFGESKGCHYIQVVDLALAEQKVVKSGPYVFNKQYGNDTNTFLVCQEALKVQQPR